MRGAASYWVLRAAAATVLLGAAASCSSGTAGGTASPASATASATPIPTGPVTAEISQFRDNYSKQIIEIQLTNTTGHALTVLGAELTSPLFAAPIIWSGPHRRDRASARTAEEPAGTAARPGVRQPGRTAGATSGAAGDARVSLRLADAGRCRAGPAAMAPATDPFGVLARNNSEMCLAREASAVATIGLDPGARGRRGRSDRRRASAAAHRAPPGAGARRDELVIDRIEETTLLAEASTAPWPRSVTVRAGGAPAASAARHPARPLRSPRRGRRQGGHTPAAAGQGGGPGGSC